MYLEIPPAPLLSPSFMQRGQRTVLAFVLSAFLAVPCLTVSHAQEDIPIPVAAETVVADEAVSEEAVESDVVSEMPAPPANDVLEDLDGQLEEMQNQLTQINKSEVADDVPDISNVPDVYYESTVVKSNQPLLPEKIDPRDDPAGRIIYVQKDFNAGDDQAILMSAKRALEMGLYDTALGFYNQLYVKNPRDPRVLMGKAISLQKMGNVQRALRAYEELLDVDPENKDARISMLGLVQEKFPMMALKELLLLYDGQPNNAALNAQIAMIYAQQKDYGSALRYLGTAISMDEDNALFYYNMAAVYDQAGQFKNALKFYEEALSVDAENGAQRQISRETILSRIAVISRRL